MNQHLSDLKLITTLHGRFTEGRLLALGIAKTAIRTAVTSRLLGEASGVLTTIPAFRRTERLRTAGLTEAVDQAAMDKANYVRRIVDGKPVLLRVVNRQNGKLMVPDPANPNRNMEVDPNDVAPVSDDDAKKEQDAEKADKPAPGQAPVTEAVRFKNGDRVTIEGENGVFVLSQWDDTRQRGWAGEESGPGDAGWYVGAYQLQHAGPRQAPVTEAHGVATLDQYKAALSGHVRDHKDRLEFWTNWLSDIADAQNVGQLNIIAQKCGVDHEFRDAKRRLNRQLCTEGGVPMWSARNEHPEHAYSEWQTEHHSSHGRCPKYHDWVEGKLEGAQHRPNCQFFAGAACSCGGQQPVREAIHPDNQFAVDDQVCTPDGSPGVIVSVGPATAMVQFPNGPAKEIKLTKLQLNQPPRRPVRESEETFNEEDWIKVVGRVSGQGKRGKVTGVAPSGHFSVVKFDDGTSASYHNSDLEHSDEPDEDEDDNLFAESASKSLADRILSEAETPRSLAHRIERLGDQFSRKPHRWGDIKKVRIPRHELSDLQTIPASELFANDGGDEAPPGAHFSSPPDRYFVLERKGQLYLVDTSGHDYARYIVELSSTGADPNAGR